MTFPWPKRVREYSLVRFGGDVAGGLVGAFIALPYGLALAVLMGLPPILGVLTSILSSPICVLLGRNPVLIGWSETMLGQLFQVAVQLGETEPIPLLLASIVLVVATATGLLPAKGSGTGDLLSRSHPFSTQKIVAPEVGSTLTVPESI